MIFTAPEVIDITCNMGACDLSGTYVLNPLACNLGALGIHIRQSPHVCIPSITQLLAMYTTGLLHQTGDLL